MLNNKQALKLNIEKLNKVHFIGITGSFNSFCASYLIDKGVEVTASEINQDNKQGEYWRKKGVLYKGGHDEKYVTEDLDLIVYPNGPIPGNPECEKAENLNIPAITIGQLTGLISLNFKTIAIAGTHGKTTTTALITWMLHKTVETPNFIVGDAEDKIAKLEKNWNYNKNSKYLVLEACEYKKQFIQRAPKPYIAVITHIDLDHTDFYKNQKEYNKAFVEFLQNAENVVIDAEMRNEREVVEKLSKEIEIHPPSPHTSNEPSPLRGENSVLPNGRGTRRVEGVSNLHLPGKHNRENLIRAYTVGKILGIKESKIIEALKSFPGISKRFEYYGKTKKGSLIYKDYAHNPQKISAVLQGALEKHSGKKIILVWQPHSFERTAKFKEEFAESIKTADTIIIPNIFAPRRESDKFKKLISEKDFVKLLKNKNPNKEIFYTNGFEKIKTKLEETDNGDSVIIFASAGDLLNHLEEILI